jgi:hypothetical protein
MKVWPNMKTKKKSCRGCRVERHCAVTGMLQEKCELGYSIAWVGDEAPNRHESVPLQRCPKPTNYSDLFEAQRSYRA